MIALPVVSKSNQSAAMLLGYATFCALYLGSGALHISTPAVLVPGAMDTVLPRLGWTVWVYLSQFLLLPVAIASARDDRDRSYTLYTMLVATALAAVIFVAWPTELARGEIPSGEASTIAWRLLYAADVPGNCFPSLHVALALVAGRALWRRGALTLGCLWPCLIALSTLTTRQHVVMDIAGAAVLALLAIGLTPRIFCLERTQLARGTADR